MSLCKGLVKTNILWASEVIPMKLFLVIMIMVMGLPLGVHAQTITVAKIIAAGGNLELDSLPTSGGDQVVFIDSTTERVRRRAIGKTDLPTAVAYEDEANTFALAQVFSGTATFNSTSSFNGIATFVATPQVQNATPALYFIETGGTTDRQRWMLRNDAETFNIESRTDGGTVTGTPLKAQHTGSLVLDPFSKQVLPERAYEGTIGSPLRKWLAVYAAELNVETLVAQETMATTGGRILVGPTTSLLEDIGESTTTIKVKHNNLNNGDRVYMESDMRVEFMAVTSAATRINRCSSNCSIEAGTTSYTTDGTVALAQSPTYRWRGGNSLRWTWTSGTANVYRSVGGELANSTQFTFSVYVRRADGAAVNPSGSQYQMYIDSTLATITPSVQDAGNGWYRLYGTRTTSGAANNAVGIALIPTGVVHYFDAWQIEIASTPSPWSETSSSYTVTRNLDGTGANVWEAGTAIFNTGTTGNGFIDLYSTRGVRASTEVGPTICGNVRQSTTYNDWESRWCMGNLNGTYGYATNMYGAAFGDPNDEHITIEPTNGFRLRNNTTTVMSLTGTSLTLDSGNVTLDPNGVIVTPSTTFLSTRGFAFDNGAAFLPGMHYYYDSGGGLSLLQLNDQTPLTLGGVQMNVSGGGGPLASFILQGQAASTTGQIQVSSYFGFVHQSGTQALRIRTDNSGSMPGGSGPMIRGNGSLLVINSGPAGALYLNADNNQVIYSSGSFIADGAGRDLGIVGNAFRYAHIGTGIGVGLGANPTYQIQLAADSAGKPTTSTWTIVSDRRSKKNVKTLPSELSSIRNLRLVEFEHNGAFGTPDGDKGVGAIADEVEAIFPSAIRTIGSGQDSYKAMDWHPIFVANVKATQELAAEVERLKQQVKSKE